MAVGGAAAAAAKGAKKRGRSKTPTTAFGKGRGAPKSPRAKGNTLKIDTDSISDGASEGSLSATNASLSSTFNEFKSKTNQPWRWWYFFASILYLSIGYVLAFIIPQTILSLNRQQFDFFTNMKRSIYKFIMQYTSIRDLNTVQMEVTENAFDWSGSRSKFAGYSSADMVAWTSSAVIHFADNESEGNNVGGPFVSEGTLVLELSLFLVSCCLLIWTTGTTLLGSSPASKIFSAHVRGMQVMQHFFSFELAVVTFAQLMGIDFFKFATHSIGLPESYGQNLLVYLLRVTTFMSAVVGMFVVVDTPIPQWTQLRNLDVLKSISKLDWDSTKVMLIVLSPLLVLLDIRFLRPVYFESETSLATHVLYSYQDSFVFHLVVGYLIVLYWLALKVYYKYNVKSSKFAWSWKWFKPELTEGGLKFLAVTAFVYTIAYLL